MKHANCFCTAETCWPQFSPPCFSALNYYTYLLGNQDKTPLSLTGSAIHSSKKRSTNSYSIAVSNKHEIKKMVSIGSRHWIWQGNQIKSCQLCHQHTVWAQATSSYHSHHLKEGAASPLILALRPAGKRATNTSAVSHSISKLKQNTCFYREVSQLAHLWQV